MPSLQQSTFNFNKSFSYNFDGGNLFSDSGLLLVRSFIEELGLRPLIEEACDDVVKRIHTCSSIVEQLIYTTIAGYHADNHSDDLRNEPVFTRVLGKAILASQPTISRCINRMIKSVIITDFQKRQST